MRAGDVRKTLPPTLVRRMHQSGRGRTEAVSGNKGVWGVAGGGQGGREWACGVTKKVEGSLQMIHKSDEAAGVLPVGEGSRDLIPEPLMTSVKRPRLNHTSMPSWGLVFGVHKLLSLVC